MLRSGWSAVDRHVNRLLCIFRRFDQAAAFGFELGALRGFERLLAEVAQAGGRVAVGAGLWAGGTLPLRRTLLPFSGLFGALGCLAFIDVSAHAFDIAFSLQACRLRNRFVGACRNGRAAGTGGVGNLHLAVGQAAFVDFRARRLGQQGEGEKDEGGSAHGVFIA